ncbi:MAG: hypothetical protein ACYDEV_17605 [Acidiferrobacter sp.]
MKENRHHLRTIRTLVGLGLVGGLIVLASCAKSGPHATILFMKERELGGPVFPTRIIVNRRYVRIDPDTGVGNYILFDRKLRVIYSVNASDRTILVIRNHAVTLARPATLTNVVKRGHSHGLFLGHKLVHYRLFTDGQQCYDIEAAQHLLPHVVLALTAYADTLAGEQAITAENTPAGLETSCDLANNVFYPGREYAQGFPVRMVDAEKNEKVLVSFKRDVRVKRSLFVLPAHYVQYSPGEVRNGG